MHYSRFADLGLYPPHLPPVTWIGNVAKAAVNLEDVKMRQIVISNSNDVIDIRDVIERFEELEADDNLLDSEKDEFESLKNLLSECRGNGGDEQWQGDWYPITLIRDSYFKDYAEELAEDIGAIDKDASWPRNCIDWNQAARELQMDYTGVEFDEVLYWVR